MISEKMQQALNEQIAMEGYSSFTYLAMSSWCERRGLIGCASFLRRQADEERMHMLKIFDYVNEADGIAIVPAVQQPPSEFDSIHNLFQSVFEHEQKVTRSIHALVRLAADEQDHATHHFLQWYVAEQREEEALMRTILDRIKLIGNGGMSLYYIDKEVEKINTKTSAKEVATAEEA